MGVSERENGCMSVCEPASISRHSYGRAFSGSMFSSKLITLGACVHVCKCSPEKPPWPLKRSPPSINYSPQSALLRTTSSSWPVTDIHNLSRLAPTSGQWKMLQHQVSFRSSPQTTSPLRQKMSLPVSQSTNKSLHRQGFLPKLAILWGWSGFWQPSSPTVWNS